MTSVDAIRENSLSSAAVEAIRDNSLSSLPSKETNDKGTDNETNDKSFDNWLRKFSYFAHSEDKREIRKEPKVIYEVEGKEEEDPWKVTTVTHNYKPWNQLTPREKRIFVLMYPVKVVLVLAFLYLFICSLDFLSSAFKLLGGKKAGKVFRNSETLRNPVAGMMMGVLVTVLVQSSSTSTSIVISMVAAGILDPRDSRSYHHGANIGTTVTNTIVALGQITDVNIFRRAFVGATIHDMFNWLSVLVLLPLEVITGYLFRMSCAIVSSMHLRETLDVNQDLLKVITKPFTTLIISVSSSGIKKIAHGAGVDTIMKFCCDKTKPDSCCKAKLSGDGSLYQDGRFYNPAQKKAVCQAVDESCAKDIASPTKSLRMSGCSSVPWKVQRQNASLPLKTLVCQNLGGTAKETSNLLYRAVAEQYFFDGGNVTTVEQSSLCTVINSTCYMRDVFDKCSSSWKDTRMVTTDVGEKFDCKVWAKEVAHKTCYKECNFLFRSVHKSKGGSLTDEGIGVILLILSLILLCVCLVCIVKLLQSILQGPMAKVIKKFVNANFPGKCGYFTGYLAILLGAGFTILVQSSSIFTSTLTPLVGIGVIELERMYPLTLGSNIGTTFTGILSALAQDAKSIPRALEIAFCHLFFNISGIVLFYPIPFTRVPIPAAKFLGNTTAKYRWFAIVYLICMFFAFPAIVFGLSVISVWMLMLLVPVGIVCVAVGIINIIQAKRKQALPKKLQNWKFLPEPLRSLRPYDNFMRKLCFCKRFQTKENVEDILMDPIKMG